MAANATGDRLIPRPHLIPGEDLKTTWEWGKLGNEAISNVFAIVHTHSHKCIYDTYGCTHIRSAPLYIYPTSPHMIFLTRPSLPPAYFTVHACEGEGLGKRLLLGIVYNMCITQLCRK